jgi:hypothetical protein
LGEAGPPRSKWRGLALALILFAVAAIWQPAASSADTPTTIRIYPNSPDIGNAFPFGIGGPSHWEPYEVFVYKNIPAFQLKPSDVLAFDTTSALNEVPIQMDIDLAAATTNGGDVAAQPFTKVVFNTQSASSPRGDTVTGNFDLAFLTRAPFSFAGGGLIIRFSNSSPAYAADATGTFNLVGAMSSDSTGFFVERGYVDTDGAAPWSNVEGAAIGAFQLIIDNPSPPFGLPSNAYTFGNLTRDRQKGIAILPVTVPGPGTLSLTGDFVKTQRTGGGATASRAVSTAGVVNLLIKSKGAAKKKLKETGKATVKFTVTYTPTGGTEPHAQTKRVKLIKKQ